MDEQAINVFDSKTSNNPKKKGIFTTKVNKLF